MGRRSRVLLVVRPVLYETALLGILRRADIDDVLSSAELEGDISGTYDVAVVTGDVPDGVASKVTIHLPGNESGKGDIIVENHSGSRTSPLIRLRQVFEALAARRRRRDPRVPPLMLLCAAGTCQPRRQFAGHPAGSRHGCKSRPRSAIRS